MGEAIKNCIISIAKYLKGFFDKRKYYTDLIKSLSDQIKEIRLDTTRLQLLNLMQHDPENVDSILLVAETYFEKLGGNWYMDSAFKKWAEEQHVKLPKWFNG